MGGRVTPMIGSVKNAIWGISVKGIRELMGIDQDSPIHETL